MGPMTTPTNDTAPEYPLIRPDQLSDAARALYSQLGSPRSLRQAQDRAAMFPETAAELIAAGLATTGWKGQLESVKVSAHYTRATGDGSVLVVIREANLDFPHKGTLLAVIEGASTMLRRDRAVTELTLRAHRDGVTDFEHSASRLFSADVVLPQLLEARDAETMWAGTLTELNAYAAGVDPLAQDDGDTHPGTCDSCETAHPFAPYLPPRIRTGSETVTVEIRPLTGH
jgi:hypothetical protein